MLELKKDDQTESDGGLCQDGDSGRAVQGGQHSNCDLNNKKDPVTWWSGKLIPDRGSHECKSYKRCELGMCEEQKQKLWQPDMVNKDRSGMTGRQGPDHAGFSKAGWGVEILLQVLTLAARERVDPVWSSVCVSVCFQEWKQKTSK